MQLPASGRHYPGSLEQVRRQRFAIRTRQMRQPPPARHRRALLQRRNGTTGCDCAGADSCNTVVPAAGRQPRDRRVDAVAGQRPALPRVTRAGTPTALRHPHPADAAAAPSTASAGAAAMSQWNDWVRLRGSLRLRHGNAGRWPATSGSPGGCSCRPAAGTTQGHSSRYADSASPSAPGRYGSRPQHGIGRRCCNVAMERLGAIARELTAATR